MIFLRKVLIVDEDYTESSCKIQFSSSGTGTSIVWAFEHFKHAKILENCPPAALNARIVVTTKTT